MINKITKISSLSRFKHFSSSHDSISLSTANLFYAPNGRGKSTVSDIIQSFINNDPVILSNRTSKVYSGTPEIFLNHSTPTVTSHYGASKIWSNPITDLECLVFDKSFIQQNVHTITVEHDHKKKMYGLIVGSGAIEARKQVVKKRSILTDLQKQQQDISKEYARLGVRGKTIKDFVSMTPEDPRELAIEKQILSKQLEAAGNPTAIKTKAVLVELQRSYMVGDELKLACSETVTGGSSEAVELVKVHSETHIQGSPQDRREFLAASVKAMGSKDASTCPTCGQSLLGDPEHLVESLFAIFSRSYLDLRRKVGSTISELEGINDAIISSKIQGDVEINATRLSGWKTYVKDLSELYDLSNIIRLARTVVDTKVDLIAQLKAKNLDLSKQITAELEFYQNAITAYDQELKIYNDIVIDINLKISTFKASVDISQKQAIEQNIIDVDNRILRAGANAQVLSANYITNEPAVTNAQTDLRTALTDFEAAQKAVIDNHGEVINKVLEKSGAKFRISDIAQGTKFGSTDPYIEYSIKIVGGVDDAQTTAGEAIGGILSDGEKNLLAFAFFWSLLCHADLKKTIAIFDDPLSSVDEIWRFELIHQLRNILDKGLHQLFILTHFQEFARVIAREIPSIKQLEITTGGAATGNSIAACDIETIAKEQQFSRIELLRTYIDDPTTAKPEDIQGEIRTCLESAMKNKYYLKLKNYIDTKGWLRDFITDENVKPLLEANGTYDDLSSLCSVSGYAHHDNPPAYRFNPEQAANYAQQTLNVLERL